MEKIIKAMMQNRVNVYGKDKNTDVTEPDGTRVFIVAANSFGPGYIKLIFDGLVWSSDFTAKGLSKPKSRPVQ